MKIVGSCFVTGRGHALFTDESWSLAIERRASARKKVRVADEEFDLLGLGSALDQEKVRRLILIVPKISDSKVEELIQNQEADLR
jgi:hypothetical protein